MAALRAWFAARDFIEIETGVLQVSPGNETHLHAFATALAATDGSPGPALYLRTSPEFACKKLLAAGERRLVEFAKVFRNRERGALHHPEFTLVEWYRAGEPYEALMADCGAILAQAAEAAGTGTLSFRGRVADPFAEPERITVAEAFAALPASICWRRCRTASRTGRASPAPRWRLESASAMTIDGGIFSAACWWKKSKTSSASAGLPFSINTRPGRRRWRGRRWTAASRSASSSMPAAWNSPTALAN